MKLFDKIFKKRSVSGSLVSAVASSYPGGLNVIEVGNEYQATKIAAVYRCVEILSSGVAGLPFRKKRRNRAEGYFVNVDGKTDRTNYIIGVKPNEHTTAYELIKNAVVQMCLLGNAYIIPRYGDNGTLQELILCSPHTVSHTPNIDIYTVNDPYNGIYGEVFCPEEIIHLRNMSLDGGRTGISTVQYAAAALGIQATADNQTKQLFAKGGRIKGIVSNDHTTTGFGEYQDKELDKTAESVDGKFKQGQDIVSLPGQVQFTPISMTSVDMQLLEHKKFGVQEICRFFGVHPDKVFAQQSNNYKASDMAQVTFITDTLNPILRKFEAEFKAKLIPGAVADDFKFMFDLSPLFTTDLTTEAAYMEKTINTGVMTINEWRRRKDLKPIEGGDVTFISCNVAPINSVKIQGEGTAKQEPQLPKK